MFRSTLAKKMSTKEICTKLKFSQNTDKPVWQQWIEFKLWMILIFSANLDGHYFWSLLTLKMNVKTDGRERSLYCRAENHLQGLKFNLYSLTQIFRMTLQTVPTSQTYIAVVFLLSTICFKPLTQILKTKW